MTTRLSQLFVIAILGTAGVATLDAQTLVDYYEFENNGTDSAGGNANGAVGANVTFTTGQIGQGAQFGTSGAGTANQIVVPQANAFDPGAGSFTMAFWAARNNVDTGNTDGIFDTLAGTNTGYQAQFVDTDIIRLRIDDVPNNDLIDSVTAITDTDMHHYAFVIDRGSDEARVYVDGLLDNLISGLNTTGALTPTQDMEIGSLNGNAATGMEGVLDELRFYDGALSAAQVAALASPAAVPEPASIAIWSLLGLGLAGVAFRFRRKAR